MCTLIPGLLALARAQLIQVVVPPTLRSVPQPLWNCSEVFSSFRASVYSQRGGISNVQNVVANGFVSSAVGALRIGRAIRGSSCKGDERMFEPKTYLHNRRLNEEQTLSRTKKTIFVQRMLIKYAVQNAFAFTYFWARLRVWFLRTNSSFERDTSVRHPSHILCHPANAVHAVEKYLNVGNGGGGHLYKLFRIIFTVSEPDRPASIKKNSMRCSYFSSTAKLYRTVLIHILTLHRPVRRQ